MKKRAVKRIFSLWAPVVGLCLIIFIQSSRPLPDITPEIPLFDKLLHVIAWTVLGFLFSRAFAGYANPLYSSFPEAKRQRPINLIWISFISAALYGVSDEIHQYFVPSRSADIFDLLADVIGSFCGAVCGARRYGVFRHRDRVTRQPVTPS